MWTVGKVDTESDENFIGFKCAKEMPILCLLIYLESLLLLTKKCQSEDIIVTALVPYDVNADNITNNVLYSKTSNGFCLPLIPILISC